MRIFHCLIAPGATTARRPAPVGRTVGTVTIHVVEDPDGVLPRALPDDGGRRCGRRCSSRASGCCQLDRNATGAREQLDRVERRTLRPALGSPATSTPPGGDAEASVHRSRAGGDSLALVSVFVPRPADAGVGLVAAVEVSLPRRR